MSTLLDVLLKNSGSIANSVNWKDLGKTVGVAVLLAAGTAIASFATTGSAGGFAPILVLVSSALVDLAHRYSTDNSAPKK